jgi:hypothetical protein
MKRVIAAAIALTILSGCADSAMMRNPETGETHDCGSFNTVLGSHKFTPDEKTRACVYYLIDHGWVREPSG